MAFFEFFQQQQQQQQAPQKEEPKCLGFECKESGKCVNNPMECPCLPGQEKCTLGDWYICISGHQNCKSFQ